MAVIFDDCISKKIVGHVPFNWSKLSSMFLKVPNSFIRGKVTGKRVNRGAGLGLEIPMDYTFYDDCVLLWLEKAFKKITENMMLTYQSVWNSCIVQQIFTVHELYGAIGLGGLYTSKIRVSTIHRLILRQMFTRFRENVSAIKLSAI